MVVVEPVKLTIENFEEFKGIESVEADDFPAVPGSAKHRIAFDRVIYIEADDYKETAKKDFRRLTKEQSVGLKNVGLVLKVVGEDAVSNLKLKIKSEYYFKFI